MTGETISAHQGRHRFGDAGEYEALTVGLEIDREKLYATIDARFDAMIAAGFVEEVRALMDAGYSPERPPLSTIGYKQIAAYLRGEMTLFDANALAKRDTRRLAKRQLTWFRREPDIVWLDPEGGAQDASALDAFALFQKFFEAREREVN